jgi:hypothetical protein
MLEPTLYFFQHHSLTFLPSVRLHSFNDLLVNLLQMKILGAFAKLRKATTSFVMFVILSAWNNSAATGKFLMKFCIWDFLENLSRKFQFY